MTAASSPVIATLQGECLRCSVVEAVLEVELHRLPCNEIGTAMLADLEALVTWVQQGAGGARAVLFYSSVAKGFSAGADLRELHAGLSAGDDAIAVPAQRQAAQQQVRSFLDRIHAAFDALDAAPLPTVAAIHGFCFGGGLELALTCDVRVADKSARFCFPELRLGLVPGFGGIPRLQRDLGNAVVRDLLLTGRSLGAVRAYELGLVSQLAGRGEALAVARQVARQAARFDPATTAAAKAFVKPLPTAQLAREKELFMRLFSSPVVDAALRSFVGRTDPLSYLPEA